MSLALTRALSSVVLKLVALPLVLVVVSVVVLTPILFFLAIIACKFNGFLIHIDIISYFTGLTGFIVSYLSGGGIAIDKVNSVISGDKANGVVIIFLG